MVIYNKKWKKNNEILVTKNKIDLKNRIMKNHPSSPGSGVPNALVVTPRPNLTLHL